MMVLKKKNCQPMENVATEERGIGSSNCGRLDSTNIAPGKGNLGFYRPLIITPELVCLPCNNVGSVGIGDTPRTTMSFSSHSVPPTPSVAAERGIINYVGHTQSSSLSVCY